MKKLKPRCIRKKIVSSLLIISMLVALVATYLIIEKKDIVKADNSNIVKEENTSNGDIEFEYSSSALDENTVRLNNTAIFNENYFKHSSLGYNHNLAKLSLAMALASSSSAESKDNWGDDFVSVVDTSMDIENIDPKTARNVYIVDVYKKLGFTNDVYEKYDISLNDTSDTIAYSIAMKKIKVNGQKYNLVIANARSVSYGAEWASNFNMDNENGLSGFRQSGEIFYNAIKDYIKKHKLGKRTKIWLPAYSRGAAAANVAAALLSKDAEEGKYKFTRDDIYGYMFATPLSSIDNDCDSELYNNIYNIVNEADIVPKTGPYEWGFRRYGQDLTIPQLLVTKKDLEKIEEGKKVKIDEETVRLIKNISYDYNRIRHTNAVNDNETVEPDDLYIAFTVNKELTEVVDLLFKSVNKEDYKAKYQGVATEIIPFFINHVRKYSASEKKWINYGDLTEYLCTKYGPEVLEEVEQVGIFSTNEYANKLDNIYKMQSLGILDEDKVSLCEYIIGAYYGIRVIAYKYGINVDVVKELSVNLMHNLWDMLEKFNINDPLCCKYVHYAEFYMAWLENYNPYTKTVLK